MQLAFATTSQQALIPEWLRGLLDSISTDHTIRGIAIIVASLILAKIVDWLCTGALRGLTRKSRTSLDDNLIRLLHRPVFLSVVLLGLGWATIEFELNDAATNFTLSALKTIAIVIWSLFFIRASLVLLQAIADRGGASGMVQTRTVPLFDNLIKIGVVGVAIYGVLIAWGMDVKAWLASAGILGIALGFAAKDTLANLFSGLFILADAPYEIGDFIVLDTGERGRVTQIGLRSTRLVTRDDIEITIPNAVIANAKIINETKGPYEKERLRVPIGVAYGSDVDLVRAVLMDVADAESRVCSDPEPRVRFRRFGESGLDFELLCWIDEPVLRGQVHDALNTTIYKRFSQESIEIPYPKRDIYIKDMPEPPPRPQL